MAKIDWTLAPASVQCGITLQKACEEPEKYRHINVQISGYNACFVDLPASVRDEVMKRTKHTQPRYLLCDSGNIFPSGAEVINTYFELVDLIEQKNRLIEQAKIKVSGDEEAMVIDNDTILFPIMRPLNITKLPRGKQMGNLFA